MDLKRSNGTLDSCMFGAECLLASRNYDLGRWPKEEPGCRGPNTVFTPFSQSEASDTGGRRPLLKMGWGDTSSRGVPA